MTGPTKLTDEVSEAICTHARAGMPLNRAAALSRINRITAWRWMNEGAAELGPKARFALNYGEARAAYLLELSDAWKRAIGRKDANTAKVIAGMLSSQSPDEFSERRATRHVDQHTTMSGEIGVNRFSAMSAEDLDQERTKISARIDAAQALGMDDSWQAAAVRMPSQVGEEDLPERAAGENNSTAQKSGSGSQTRKTQSGGLGVDDPGVSQKNSPSRAQASDASVVAGLKDVVADGLAPDHNGERGASSPGVPPSPILQALAAEDDDEDTQL